jgi:hypothetical protein
LICGLVSAVFIVEATLAVDVLLVTMGILGLLTAAAWGPPLLSWVLAVLVGLTLALDSRPEVTTSEEMVRMLIGSGLVAAVLLAIVAEGSTFLQGNVLRIAARVVGSWIAAGAILVLSLRIATRIATG